MSSTVHLPDKKIEIFCGTGGVGKTTLATARAVDLATNGKKVLLITIDPAKRLKEVLKIDDEDSGKLHSVSPELFNIEPKGNFQLDALLMSPKAVIKRMGEETGTSEELKNHIIEILIRPHGGMNEILAIIEVEHYLRSGHYDTIVLDTPPGRHFIDFLQAARKINNFFDKSFVEIFKYLGKTISSQANKLEESTPKRFVTMIVSTGVKKLLKYLEKVTGANFVDEFVNAIVALYKNRDSFLQALALEEQLKNQSVSNWFLVTSVEQHKILEAQELQNKASTIMHSDNFMVINKCLAHHLILWNPLSGGDLESLKDSMLSREDRVKGFAKQGFEQVLEFPEVLGPSPQEHVSELASTWERLNEAEHGSTN